MIRTFVRAQYPLKNLLSNIELLLKSVVGRSASYDADFEIEDSDCGYYATVHVRYGHIPLPLVWERNIRSLKWQWTEMSYRDCWFENQPEEIKEAWFNSQADLIEN